jgi:hypothetical protein
MNPCQKCCVLIFRLVRTAFALFGVSGPVTIGLWQALEKNALPYPAPLWAVNCLWVAGGIALLVFAQPVGRLFGRGLD